MKHIWLILLRITEFATQLLVSNCRREVYATNPQFPLRPTKACFMRIINSDANRLIWSWELRLTEFIIHLHCDWLFPSSLSHDFYFLAISNNCLPLVSRYFLTGTGNGLVWCRTNALDIDVVYVGIRAHKKVWQRA